jgi:hypothetical protein
MDVVIDLDAANPGGPGAGISPSLNSANAAAALRGAAASSPSTESPPLGAVDITAAAVGLVGNSSAGGGTTAAASAAATSAAAANHMRAIAAAAAVNVRAATGAMPLPALLMEWVESASGNLHTALLRLRSAASTSGAALRVDLSHHLESEEDLVRHLAVSEISQLLFASSYHAPAVPVVESIDDAMPNLLVNNAAMVSSVAAFSTGVPLLPRSIATAPIFFERRWLGYGHFEAAATVTSLLNATATTDIGSHQATAAAISAATSLGGPTTGGSHGGTSYAIAQQQQQHTPASRGHSRNSSIVETMLHGSGTGPVASVAAAAAAGAWAHQFILFLDRSDEEKLVAALQSGVRCMAVAAAPPTAPVVSATPSATAVGAHALNPLVALPVLRALASAPSLLDALGSLLAHRNAMVRLLASSLLGRVQAAHGVSKRCVAGMNAFLLLALDCAQAEFSAAA